MSDMCNEGVCIHIGIHTGIFGRNREHILREMVFSVPVSYLDFAHGAP